MEYYKTIGTDVFTNSVFDSLIGEFCFYLSDDSKQDLSITAAQIKDLVNIFVTNNIITQYVSTIW